MSSLASVLAAVRIAEGASHVWPISQASKTLRPIWGCPAGHGHRSRFQNRVDPMMAPFPKSTIAKGTAVPGPATPRPYLRIVWLRSRCGAPQSINRGRVPCGRSYQAVDMAVVQWFETNVVARKGQALSCHGYKYAMRPQTVAITKRLTSGPV
jgi:hypothetical protein